MKLVSMLVILLLAAPTVSLASGQNSPKNRTKDSNEKCPPGAYWDARDGLCVYVNWR